MIQSFGVCIVNEWNNLPSWVVEAENLDKHNLDTHWTIPIMFPVMKITNE